MSDFGSTINKILKFFKRALWWKLIKETENFLRYLYTGQPIGWGFSAGLLLGFLNGVEDKMMAAIRFLYWSDNFNLILLLI